jgi:hypothetical protein
MRRWMAAIAGMVLVPAVASAQGCGPTRLKVSESVSLALRPAEVWSLVGNFQDMSWDSDVVAAAGTGGNTAEAAARKLVLKGGATMEESLYAYDAAGMSYAYHIDRVDLARLPVQNASATLEVRPADGGKSVLTWKAAFYRNLAPGEGAPDEADAKAKAAMAEYLRSALRGLAARANPKS